VGRGGARRSRGRRPHHVEDTRVQSHAGQVPDAGDAGPSAGEPPRRCAFGTAFWNNRDAKEHVAIVQARGQHVAIPEV
jgi:hypothetical protein